MAPLGGHLRRVDGESVPRRQAAARAEQFPHDKARGQHHYRSRCLAHQQLHGLYQRLENNASGNKQRRGGENV